MDGFRITELPAAFVIGGQRDINEGTIGEEHGDAR